MIHTSLLLSGVYLEMLQFQSSFSPLLSIVQRELGIKFIPVWSQLNMRSPGRSSSSTVSTISLRNVCFASLKSSDVQVILVEPHRFAKSILFNNDFAHGTDSVLGPPWSTSLVLSITFTMPLAAAHTIVVLTGHPLSQF